MAIDALLGEQHNLKHDLESFFWGLFWICIHWNGPGEKRRESKFEHWNFLSTEKLARGKTAQVSKRLFSMMTDEFTPYCKQLINCIRELRKVVLPVGIAMLEGMFKIPATSQWFKDTVVHGRQYTIQTSTEHVTFRVYQPLEWVSIGKSSLSPNGRSLDSLVSLERSFSMDRRRVSCCLLRLPFYPKGSV